METILLEIEYTEALMLFIVIVKSCVCFYCMTESFYYYFYVIFVFLSLTAGFNHICGEKSNKCCKLRNKSPSCSI